MGKKIKMNNKEASVPSSNFYANLVRPDRMCPSSRMKRFVYLKNTFKYQFFLVISKKFTEAKSINICSILGLRAHSKNFSLWF
jgi:hypothetical protein